jgi:uncharacterized protein CbrC (UPF0167 family)
VTLPQFRYHPDPIATGSVVAEPVLCACCRLQRPYTYVGPVFAEAELDRALCPWCIADGSAADMFDAQFTDVYWSDADVPVTVTTEVLHRTPGFHGWQQERWLHHCNDAAAFYGRAGAADLAPFPDALNAIREERRRHRWPDHDIENYLQQLNADGQPTAYRFRCLHCGSDLAYSDFT